MKRCAEITGSARGKDGAAASACPAREGPRIRAAYRGRACAARPRRGQLAFSARKSAMRSGVALTYLQVGGLFWRIGGWEEELWKGVVYRVFQRGGRGISLINRNIFPIKSSIFRPPCLFLLFLISVFVRLVWLLDLFFFIF